ncbi:MAG: cupin domain-containing protein, partial [Bacteroidia bacterium]|nr:cupin domain-containing protein [Bacteroidia bacterium]
MKVYPFRIPKPDSDAIIYQEDHQKIFYNKYHEHEEIQVSCIAEGEGTLIVGETVNTYKKGDIIVIGSHIPHVFRSEPQFDKTSIMLSLFFTEKAFGEQFFDLEELKGLRPFFNRTEGGFKATSNLKKINLLFSQLYNATKFDRFLILMHILKLLSNSKFVSLSSNNLNRNYSDLEGTRMSAVMAFTIENYNHQITLEKVSEIAAMTK